MSTITAFDRAYKTPETKRNISNRFIDAPPFSILVNLFMLTPWPASPRSRPHHARGTLLTCVQARAAGVHRRAHVPGRAFLLQVHVFRPRQYPWRYAHGLRVRCGSQACFISMPRVSKTMRGAQAGVLVRPRRMVRRRPRVAGSVNS